MRGKRKAGGRSAGFRRLPILIHNVFLKDRDFLFSILACSRIFARSGELRQAVKGLFHAASAACAVIAAYSNRTLRGVPVFDAFVEGAKEGLAVIYRIFPVLVGLLTAMAMFRASGGFDIIALALRPAADFLGLPVELLPVAAIRPMSGSGSIALLRELMQAHGPDSFIGRAAAVMSASTETSVYVIALYMGGAGVRNQRPAGIVRRHGSYRIGGVGAALGDKTARSFVIRAGLSIRPTETYKDAKPC